MTSEIVNCVTRQTPAKRPRAIGSKGERGGDDDIIYSHWSASIKATSRVWEHHPGCSELSCRDFWDMFIALRIL